jgi:hypothetical protein
MEFIPPPAHKETFTHQVKKGKMSRDKIVSVESVRVDKDSIVIKGNYGKAIQVRCILHQLGISVTTVVSENSIGFCCVDGLTAEEIQLVKHFTEGKV